MLLVFSASMLSGLLLFFSGAPFQLWWLQLFSFLPFLYALHRWCRTWRSAVVAGCGLGFAYAALQGILLSFPLPFTLGLGFMVMGHWTLIALGSYVALRSPSPLGALGVGAMTVMMEWINYAWLPIWGTAQCFARVWSAAPWAIQLVTLTGISGLVFILLSSQALVIQLLSGRAYRKRSAMVLGGLLLSTVLYNAWAWSRPSSGQLKVAAMSWTSSLQEHAVTPADVVWQRRFLPLFRQAVVAGARLVVSPEVGFLLGPATRDVLLKRIGTLAQHHQITIAVGYFDQARQDNRIAFFDQTGVLRSEYRKTHLIPFVEQYQAGSGELSLLEVDGYRLGGMICQDDNFPDLARAYGRVRTQILAVPTQDWPQVKHYHLENSLFRGVENGYALVRAGQNGISVIASPRGEVLAIHDPFLQGPGIIVADVPLGQGGTYYSWIGEWLPLLCLVFLMMSAGVRARHEITRWRSRRRAA